MKSQLLRKIKEILEKHKGKNNQISSGEIAKKLNLKQEDTHVEPRKYILETIKKYKIPIAGRSKGYYLLSNREELEEYLKSLDNRIEEVKKRKQKVITAFQQYYKKK